MSVVRYSSRLIPSIEAVFAHHDAIGFESLAPLKFLDGFLTLGAENTVRSEAEFLLNCLDRVALVTSL